VESNRFTLFENISQHDLADTYYPAWRAVIAEGGATGFMCSYPAVNGVPMCGNALFETTLMKDTWGLGLRGGSYVQSDCGAVENIARTYHYAANATFAAAIALNAGTDVDCGDAFPDELARAIAMGLTTESTLDASLTRTLTLHFLAGRFDPSAAQPFMAIPFDAVGSPANLALAAESALQGMVLLRNDGGLLPLRAGGALRLAVVGPLANDSAVAGNYFEECARARVAAARPCVPRRTPAPSPLTRQHLPGRRGRARLRAHAVQRARGLGRLARVRARYWRRIDDAR
jgi:beta-glucosidase-like glycosyl hydrolase